MYNFHQYFRAGASLDVQYDESANIKEYEADYNDQAEHRFYRPPFKGTIGSRAIRTGRTGHADLHDQCKA